MTMPSIIRRHKTDIGYIPMTLRGEAHRSHCEACGRKYGEFTVSKRGKRILLSEALDHIFPRRFLLNFKLSPNMIVNLVSVCKNSCHPQKIKAENALFMGDSLTYVQTLRRLNWPKPLIKKAAEFYGFNEIVSLLERDGTMTTT
jgi:hypothetical protein